MKILVVEDEDALAKGLKFNFELEGYEVALAGDGVTAVRMFEAAEPSFELIVLDLMLPGMSGYEVCKQIRQRDPRVSILVLSARTLSEDRAMAFDCGTDQYLSKPFALPELLSRIRNIEERRRMLFGGAEPASPETSRELRIGKDVVVNFDRFELHVKDAIQTLTTMETQLLRYFAQHEDRVLSRAQLMQDVWGDSSTFGSRTIDNFVMRLRRLIEPDPANPRHFLSVRGTGYRFVSNPAEPTEPPA